MKIEHIQTYLHKQYPNRPKPSFNFAKAEYEKKAGRRAESFYETSFKDHKQLMYNKQERRA